MKWKTAAIGLIGLTSALHGAPSAAGDAPDKAPRLHAFSPASVHPGDAFLIDAEFAGHAMPHVWVGSHRVPRSRLRLDSHPGEPGMRRIWGRVPARIAAGDHVLKIGTRAGRAVAAKPIQVASCISPPTTPGTCPDDIPDVGADLTVTGSGYSTVIRLASSPSMSQDGSDPTLSSMTACGDDGEIRCLTIRLATVALAEAHVGDLATLGLSYYDGKTHYQWEKEPGGNLKVVEATPTHIGVCLNTVFTFKGVKPPGLPQTVTMKGYLVFRR